MKTITIEVPDGCEVKIVEKQQSKELPKSWEELDKINGYHADSCGSIFKFDGLASKSFKNTFPTKAEAEASIALAQLLQLRNAYNGDWRPDWNDVKQEKYKISHFGDRFSISSSLTVIGPLVFFNRSIAQQFLENFKDLIEIAKPLL